MAWVEIMPGFETLFRGRDSATSFVEWNGILVNHHRRRQVAEVVLPTSTENRFFLKKQFNMSWHERFRNAWQGFGWCSTAVREAAILIAAQRAGVACPEIAAFGEHGRSAFLLTRGEDKMVELRALSSTLQSNDQRRLAVSLGRALAHLHDAGFEHPDLFAKHILVDPIKYRICFLDWARARKRRIIGWQTRCRDLAVLDATLYETLAKDGLRLRCLHAYLQACTRDTMPLRRVAVQIREIANALRRQRHLREIGQPATPPRDQQFVPTCDGRLLLVRSYHEQIAGAIPPWLMRLTTHGHENSNGADSSVVVHDWPILSAKWEIPPMAHTLFRLARFGVPAPRLLAVGASASRVFAVMRCADATPFAEVFVKAPASRRRDLLEQAGRIVRQIHEAGHRLPVGDTWARRLGVVRETGAVLFNKIEPLERTNASWQDIAPLEFSRQSLRLKRSEQLRFLRSYLGTDATLSTLQMFVPRLSTMERQRAA